MDNHEIREPLQIYFDKPTLDSILADMTLKSSKVGSSTLPPFRGYMHPNSKVTILVRDDDERTKE